jgi:2-polyprenyl-3-methyl-5-hydroxy-6-metoxy-1,4-benzoquinol methylase
MRSKGVVRDKLKRLPGLRSAIYLAIVLRQMIADEWRDPDSFDRVFGAGADPWRSDSEAERVRFATTLEVLDASGRERFGDAIELGCAEGIFTERIAPRCEALTALDFSEVALSRARTRPGAANVTFRRWDMRREPVPGRHDLVIAMGVITSLYRPRDVRRVAEGVVDAIRPDGFLLFSDVRQSRVFESAWWGPMILRGGEQIRRLLTRHPQLELVKAADTDSHVFALYRRRPGAA